VKIDLALEWFLNPDHLPFIVGLKKGFFQREGIELNIIQPDEHYDGFEALKKGDIQMATNEPLHLIEQFDKSMLSLGSFFTTRGGVLLTENGLQKLKNGENIEISSPVSNKTTNTIGFELIKRYCEKSANIEVKESQVKFVATDFYHIKNIQKGFDGAWLFFYNFEGVEAKHNSLDLIYIDSTTADFPNFSALDIFINRDFYSENIEDVKKFVDVVKESIKFIKNNLSESMDLYFSYSEEERSSLGEDIVTETAKCFDDNFTSDHKKQIDVLNFFKDIKVTDLELNEFKEAFLK